MTEQNTDIKLGFKSDTSGLRETNREIFSLRNSFGKLLDSVSRVAIKADEAKANLRKMPTSIPDVARAAAMLRTTGAITVPGARKGEIENLPVRSLGGLLGQSAMARGLGAARTVGSVGGGVLRGITGGLGLSAMGLGVGALGVGAAMIAGKGVRDAHAYEKSLDLLSKQLRVVDGEQAKFTRNIMGTSEEIGIAAADVLALERSYIRLAGGIQGTGAIQDQFNVSSRMAYSMGLDANQTTQQFGHMAQSGVFGEYAQNGMKVRDFALMLGNAIQQGGMTGRENELIDSIQTLVGVQTQTLTRPQNVGGMVDLLTAMNASKTPGLVGAQGAQLLARVNAGIQNPGGGDMGEYYLYRAFGQKNYFKFKYQQEEGAFGEHNNLGAVMGQFSKDYKDPYARWMAMSRTLNMSMHQAREMEKTYSAMGQYKGGATAFQKRIRRVAGDGDEEKGAKIAERLDPRKIQFLASAANVKTVGELQNVFKDTRLKGVSEEDKRKIFGNVTDANAAVSAEQVDKALKAIMDATIEKTGTENVVTALTKIDNSILGVGKVLYEPVKKAAGAVNWIAERFGKPKNEEEQAIADANRAAGSGFAMGSDFYEKLKQAKKERAEALKTGTMEETPNVNKTASQDAKGEKDPEINVHAAFYYNGEKAKEETKRTRASNGNANNDTRFEE